MTERAPTPPDSRPTRPDAQALIETLINVSVQYGQAFESGKIKINEHGDRLKDAEAALVAYVRHLEAEVERLRGELDDRKHDAWERSERK